MCIRDSAKEPRAAQQPKNARRAKPAARPEDEDAGLLLISRRVPAQKFASFEEYIAAHGGVSSPISGDDGE